MRKIYNVCYWGASKGQNYNNRDLELNFLFFPQKALIFPVLA